MTGWKDMRIQKAMGLLPKHRGKVRREFSAWDGEGRKNEEI